MGHHRPLQLTSPVQNFICTMLVAQAWCLFLEHRVTMFKTSLKASRPDCNNNSKFVSFFSLDPVILPCQQVDKGAIKFLLSGANVMCRGLTSPGAKLADLPKGAIVVSYLCVMSCHLISHHSMFLQCHVASCHDLSFHVLWV